MRNKELDDLELVIGKAIKYGVIASAVIILAGLAAFIITGSSGYQGNYYPTNILTILRDCAALKPYAIMMTGIMLLILTPVIRVGVSILVFAKEHDRKYVLITAFVFVVLIISFFLGVFEK